MPITDFQVPTEFDYLAIFAWAVSGAILGLRKKLDLIGVLVVAMVSSIGGGLLRDGLLLQRTPPVLTDTWYLPLIAVAVLLVVLVRNRLHNSETVRKVVAFVDALGTPAFAVVGLQLALQTNIHLPGVLLIGCISGMGGGLIRDILLGEIPEVMKPGHYLVIPLIGVCIFFLSFTQGLGAPVTPMAWITVAIFFVIRVLTLRFDWQTTPLLKDDKI
jgi:uncharacterized membrane protein YeiH